MSVGTTYGKYFLLKKLATGGMGEVFLARQQGPAGYEKILVIKRILEHLTDNMDYLEQFLLEAKLQARMSHGSIVQIFDLGQAEDGTFYLAMEYVHGKSLVELLTRTKGLKQRVPPALVAQIIERAADGLSYAHNMTDNSRKSLNVIHRDISPHNLLVSYQGDVKIIDFGIAKSEISVVKTETGTIKGKFFYMSPEQSSARAHIDKRSDVFSLGIVLYECLAGENPFVRPNVVLALEAIQKTDPPPLSAAAPELAPFDPIVAKALAKDPEGRYADASLLKDDLAALRASGALGPQEERLGAYVSRIFKDKLAEESRILADTNAASLNALETPVGPAGRKPAPRPLKWGASLDGPMSEASIDASVQDWSSSPRARISKPDLPPLPPPAGASPSSVRETRAEGGGGDLVAETRITPAGAIEPEPREKETEESEAEVDGEEGSYTETTAGGGELGVGWWPYLAVALGVGAAVLFVYLVTASVNRDDPRALVAAPDSGAAAASAAQAQQSAPKVGGVQVLAVPVQDVVSQREESVRRNLEEEREAAARRAEEARRLERARLEEERRAEGARRQALARKAAEAGARAEEVRRDTPKAVAAAVPGRRGGTLFVRTVPPCEMRFNGRPVAGNRVDLNGSDGVVELGGEAAPLRMRLAQQPEGAFELSAEPWVIVYVDGLSKGRTPVGDLRFGEEASKVSLKRPGMDQDVQLIVRYSRQ